MAMKDGSVDLRKLNFGELAAENDRALQQYFVETEAYSRIESCQRWMVMGNRGVGKTAIFRTVAEAKKAAGACVIELSPEDYSYELAGDVLRNEMSGAWQKGGAFTAAWKWLLLILAFKELANSAVGSRRKPEGKLHVFLRDRYKDVAAHPIDALIGYMKRIEGLKLGKYEAGVVTRDLNTLYKLDELEPAMEAFQEALAGREVYILIDELDRGWDSSEDAQYFVSGLFRAAISLNQQFANLHILVSLRQELYHSIPSLYEDAQKHRDVIERLQWNEESLLKLIASRIRSGLGRTEDGLPDVEVWSEVFSDVLSYRNTRSYNYVIDRTLLRPRELISFATAIKNEAVAKKAPIDYAIIAAAERVYSKDRFDDIVSEYRFQYPGLDWVLEQFRGSLYRLDRGSLEDLCMEIILRDPRPESLDWIDRLREPRDLIQILWEVGFLMARNVGGQKGVVRSGSQYVGSYQLSNLPLDGVQNFRVHPGFHSHLGLKEK